MPSLPTPTATSAPWDLPGWTLVWHDEFDGPTIDRAKWTFDTGGQGWGNNELEYYTDRPENARVEGGGLVIEARQDEFANRHYTSARLNTQGLGAWRYGRVEARIRLPRGQGIWPAFWMLGDNINQARWPACGEIDIMENIGRQPGTVHGTLHGPGYSGAQGVSNTFALPSGALADNDYVYAIEWEPDVVRWYINQTLYATVKRGDVAGHWVFDHPFFILLNVAVGGDWPGDPDASTTFPQKMRVDYVRVYQRPPAH